MEKKRDSFPFYRSFRDALKDLPSDGRARLFMAIADYSLDGIEPSLDGIELTIWKLIRPNLVASRTKYENGCKGAEDGVKGGNPNFAKGKPNPYYANEDNPNHNPNHNPNKDRIGLDRTMDRDRIGLDKDNGVSFDTSQPITPIIEFEEVKPTKPKRTKFAPPTIENVVLYAAEQELEMDVEGFFYYYESQGWRVGKNPMKDWKSAMKRWAREDKKRNQQNQQRHYGNNATDSKRQRDAELAEYLAAKVQ